MRHEVGVNAEHCEMAGLIQISLGEKTTLAERSYCWETKRERLFPYYWRSQEGFGLRAGRTRFAFVCKKLVVTKLSQTLRLPGESGERNCPVYPNIGTLELLLINEFLNFLWRRFCPKCCPFNAPTLFTKTWPLIPASRSFHSLVFNEQQCSLLDG